MLEDCRRILKTYDPCFLALRNFQTLPNVPFLQGPFVVRRHFETERVHIYLSIPVIRMAGDSGSRPMEKATSSPWCKRRPNRPRSSCKLSLKSACLYLHHRSFLNSDRDPQGSKRGRSRSNSYGSKRCPEEVCIRAWSLCGTMRLIETLGTALILLQAKTRFVL